MNFFKKPSKIQNFTVNSEGLIRKTALQTLDIEIATLVALKSSIDQAFVKGVQAIISCGGRVVISGIGKSAIVAKKIVATLNSTGTPALFMHAADAIHGDLGMIQSDDVVVCLSKSGETPEIKILIPLLKTLGNTLIGIVSNLDSYLAKQADFVLHTPIAKEADPNNLAPTASTTAQIALGDALATALLALRGFTPKHFAQYHPGGVLGKQLYLRVRDLCFQHESPSVYLNDSLHQAILEMTSKRLGATAVLDEHQQLKGIITDGDLRRMLEKKQDLNYLLAKDIMSVHPKTIQKDAMAVNALQLMRMHSITQLLVVDGSEYLGMVHLHDLIKEGLI